MKNNIKTLERIRIHEMRISEPVKKIFEQWRAEVQRPTAAIFEDLVRFAIENGFKPSTVDRRFK